MQRACLQSSKITGQQINCENDVVGLIGPPTEAKVKINNKIVNSLLDSGSQVSAVSKSYYSKHLSSIALQSVDMPLKMETAGGGTVDYYGQIT